MNTSMHEDLFQIILSPYMSEKAVLVGEKRSQHVFKVAKCATKSEIKKAIEVLFNTKVKQVRVVNMREKTRNFRGIEGVKKSWKKAYITLYPDQKLDLGIVQ